MKRADLESYRSALQYFKKMKKIYFSLGYQKEFKFYLNNLRSNNIKKRLLQQELSKLESQL